MTKWSASAFQSHTAVQELFVPEKRSHSKPENKLLSPKECKVLCEEKVKEKGSSSCSSSCNALIGTSR